MKIDLSVKIGKLKLKNPMMVASGTFGYAEEFKDFIDLKSLGAIVTKTITLRPRKGNPSPRTCETPSGMLNSIGLENPGLDSFIKDKLSFLTKIKVPVIVSIASEHDPEEFVALARRLDKIKEVAAIELNISCPNIKHTQLLTESLPLISQDPRASHDLVRRVRRVTRKTLITKLSPNVTCIPDVALAVERAGSDAVSLVNTLSGMCIDVKTGRPKLASATGGLSGPCIRPVAVKMTWDVYRKIKLPIIGMGGIIDTSSALEFIIAGATAVSVGTGNFVWPSLTTDILKGIKAYLSSNKIHNINTLRGSLKI